MIPITQIDQCSLKCLATLIGIEVEEAVKNDPEFMERFKAWKAKRDEEEVRHESSYQKAGPGSGTQRD